MSLKEMLCYHWKMMARRTISKNADDIMVNKKTKPWMMFPQDYHTHSILLHNVFSFKVEKGKFVRPFIF